MYRTKFNTSFNQPVYEQWLSEAVASGRIEAPGFFDDPAVRQAWCGCLWMGASMGHVDPLKEVNAAAARIANNITTQEQEAMEYNGNNWDEIVKQRTKEVRETASLMQQIQQMQEASGSSGESNEDEEEEDEE